MATERISTKGKECCGKDCYYNDNQKCKLNSIKAENNHHYIVCQEYSHFKCHGCKYLIERDNEHYCEYIGAKLGKRAGCPKYTDYTNHVNETLERLVNS